MLTFDSSSIYVTSATTSREKLARVNAIITALEDVALKAAANGDISQYSLDDGQVKIMTTYRTAEDVSKSIQAFEVIKQRYINQINGRMVRLVDSKNFRNGRNQ